jgi:hypothetical protein
MYIANWQVHLDEMSRCERNSPAACECRNIDETCPRVVLSFARIRTSYAASAGVNFRPSRSSLLRAKKRFKNMMRRVYRVYPASAVESACSGECL